MEYNPNLKTFEKRSLIEMKKFRINEFIELRLGEDGITNIFIKDQLFLQCKFLLLDIPRRTDTSFEEIRSIDDAAIILDHSLEENRIGPSIPPETEFWGHSSNLQAWSENNYDTCLLHSNLSFPLLERLTKVGDPVAKRVFKEELVKRFKDGNDNVREFLYNGSYLDFLEGDEYYILFEPSEVETIKELESIFGQRLHLYFGISKRDPIDDERPGLAFTDKHITTLYLHGKKIEKLPESIKNLKELQVLIAEYLNLKIFPEFLCDLSKLQYLSLSENNIKVIPRHINKLLNLEILELFGNEIEKIPETIGSLRALKTLYISINELSSLPLSLSKLISLEKLYISDNLFVRFPEVIKSLRFLKDLSISNNPFSKQGVLETMQFKNILEKRKKRKNK
ncbi:hypothetical protein LCGC14_1348020 [marine sediment metagenome]|uniref:Disease resistance R13L4/SHOC-2-like LRR domain-containing protein n=1 Tax=marine sediment metagenome TaxID=412755 RepID=A0A0F9MSH6_9ZZZZ